MKKALSILGLFLLLSIAFLLTRTGETDTTPLPRATDGPDELDTAVIRMTPAGFEPKNIAIARGTTVTFVNEDARDRWPASAIHPTHDIYPEFDPLAGILPSASWSFTFNDAGIWRMHDHLIPNFTGTITVKE